MKGRCKNNCRSFDSLRFPSLRYGRSGWRLSCLSIINRIFPFDVACRLCLLFLIAPRAFFAQRLPATVVAAYYMLTLAPDMKAATFSGEATVDVMVNAPTRAITLNAIEIEIQSVNEIGWGNLVLNIRYTGILNNELRGLHLSKTAKRNYEVMHWGQVQADLGSEARD